MGIVMGRYKDLAECRPCQTKNFQGAQTWIDGSSFVGSWALDQPHGWGTQYFSNGNVAQGAVVNGTFEGQGLHFRWGTVIIGFVYFFMT